MAISRRNFLSATGSFVAFSAVSPLQAHARGAAEGPAFDLREEVFRPLIGSTFRARGEGKREMTLSLVSVTPLDREKNNARHAFTLRFHQLSGGALPQGTYRFSHPQTGEFLLFVVPGARTERGVFTAVVNRV
ncbi:MAG TPA: hypothetical protein VF980_00085 [Thermoanaerobaculia bacterium]